jgi:hypothetical protein
MVVLSRNLKPCFSVPVVFKRPTVILTSPSFVVFVGSQIRIHAVTFVGIYYSKTQNENHRRGSLSPYLSWRTGENESIDRCTLAMDGLAYRCAIDS